MADDLKARLQATEFNDDSTRAPYQRLINPDGPEAASRIEALEGALTAMLLEHDAGGITLATSREARALLALQSEETR